MAGMTATSCEIAVELVNLRLWKILPRKQHDAGETPAPQGSPARYERVSEVRAPTRPCLRDGCRGVEWLRTSKSEAGGCPDGRAGDRCRQPDWCDRRTP